MKRKILDMVLGLFLVASCLGIMFLVYGYGEEPWIYFLLLFFFVLSLFLMPALHELGHLVCGKLCGMRLVSVRIAFWEIRRKGDGFICAWVGLQSFDSCRMYPVKANGIKGKFAFFAAGGLLLNALYLAICTPVVFVLDNPFVWVTLGGTLPYCAYLFILNFLPLSNETGDFDGAVLWGLIKNDSSQIVATNLLAVEGFLAQGFTPGEIDKSLYFDLPQLPEDDVNFSLLQYWRYAYYLDKGEVKEAVKSITRLEDCLEYVPSVYLAPIYCELTYVYSFLEENKELAERYHARVEREIEYTHATDEYRAKLAYAKLCNNKKMQEEYLLKCKQSLSEELLCGVRKYEEKLIDQLYGV